jgi:hypothetical protein
MACLYGNQEENPVWLSVKRQTRAWRMREKKIYQLLQTNREFPKYLEPENRTHKRMHDLMESSTIYIVVDSINKKETRIGETKSFNHLQAELVRHFAATLPSLAIQTGMNYSSISTPIDMVALRTPVVFLDVHQRTNGHVHYVKLGHNSLTWQRHTSSSSKLPWLQGRASGPGLTTGQIFPSR